MTFWDYDEEDHLDEPSEPYEYLPVSQNTPSQVRRNALGKAKCLAELDGFGNLERELGRMINDAENRRPHECPGCRRIMSFREHWEQGACNECIEDGRA